MEKAFHKLFGKPEGFWGRIGGNIMARSNVEINRWTVALLPLQSEDTVLEIGFGPGVALELMSKIITKGKIFGIDSSEVMLLQAKRRNAQAIKEGRVELRLADVSQLPISDRTRHLGIFK